ncbi:N-myc-interactor-like isoform X1 [Lampetra fluviatilis]
MMLLTSILLVIKHSKKQQQADQTAMDDTPDFNVTTAAAEDENNEMRKIRLEAQKALKKKEHEMEQMQRDYDKKIRDLQKAIDNEHAEVQKKLAEISQHKQEMEVLKEELENATSKCQKLEEKQQLSASLPEKSMSFSKSVPMKLIERDSKIPIIVEYEFVPRIIYPLKGPQALITFESEEVAQNVIAAKCHNVAFDGFKIEMKAQSPVLEAIQEFKISTEVSRQQIIVSEIPDILDEEQMTDKLELHFYKVKNGGGDIEKVEYNKKERTAIITFVKSSVAGSAVRQKKQYISIGREDIRVKVSPVLNGDLMNFKTFTAVSRRTVLLTGIQEVLTQEEMEDQLEIHFQKPSNGGGEVEDIVYIPKSKCALVGFIADK